MPLLTSLSQASLAGAVLISTIGTYIGLSPPHPNADTIPPTGDLIRRFNLASKHITKVAMAPLGILALHASTLAYLYPDIPSGCLRHGLANGLNTSLITWSTATSVPLALILCAGIPLRLMSYVSLGKNFTFALSQPDRLTTTGIYQYIQHPSYTGVAILVFSNLALLARADGVLSCWIPPSWYRALRHLAWACLPTAVTLALFVLRIRVIQEERMLKAKFGVEWERWHAKTPRFLPWAF